MSNSEVNELEHRDLESGTEPSPQPEPTGWQGAIAQCLKFQEYRTTIRHED